MRTDHELFAAHMCGWDQATLASDAPTEPDTATARALSRRQVLNGIGVLTAAALLQKAGLRDHVIVMVGGAPVTQEYADAVGADAYAPDASATVKRAKDLIARRRAAAAV